MVSSSCWLSSEAYLSTISLNYRNFTLSRDFTLREVCSFTREDEFLQDKMIALMDSGILRIDDVIATRAVRACHIDLEYIHLKNPEQIKRFTASALLKPMMSNKGNLIYSTLKWLIRHTHSDERQYQFGYLAMEFRDLNLPFDKISF